MGRPRDTVLGNFLIYEYKTLKRKPEGKCLAVSSTFISIKQESRNPVPSWDTLEP